MQRMPTVRTPGEIDERPPTARPDAHHGPNALAVLLWVGVGVLVILLGIALR